MEKSLKRLLWILAALLLSVPAFAGTIPVTGTIRNPQGNLFNGRIRFILSTATARDFTASNLIVAQLVEYPVQNGTLPAAARITPNDVLQPANTFYTAQYVTAFGTVIAQNVFYIQSPTFNIGNATPTPLTTSNISFTRFVGLDQVTSKNINNRRMCDQFTGATEGAKILACVNDLPSTGGTADASGIEGNQTWSSCWATGITKRATVVIGSGTHAIAANCTIPANITLELPDGAILSPNTGVTLTLTAKPNGSDSTHFAGLGSVKLPETYFTWHGALCDNSTNDAAAIQAAADSVSPVNGVGANAGIVHGCGIYRPAKISTTLNLTNSRTSTTLIRDGLRMTDINLVGETGDGWAIVETTGSQFLELSGIIQSGSSNKSTVGLYQGNSSTLPQTQNQKISLRIVMHDDAAANGGAGTIGLWNFGAEENSYFGTYILNANIGMYLTGLNVGAGVGSYGHSYQTLSANHSNGVNTFSGETAVITANQRTYPIITENVNSLHFDNLFISATSSVTGTNDVAWLVLGALDGADARGTIETFATVMQVNGVANGVNARWTQGTITQATDPHIILLRGGEGIILNSDMTFKDTVSPNRNLFQATPSAPADIISCYIANSTFRTSIDQQYLQIPENMKFNQLFGNVHIYGVLSGFANETYSYFVGNQRDVIDIPPTSVWVSGGIAEKEVVRFIAPTNDGSNSALTATVRIHGQVMTASNSTTAASTRYVDAVSTISIHPSTYAITVSGANADQFAVIGGGATAVAPTAANVNAAGNDLSTVTVKQTASGTTYVSIIITPTHLGANTDTIAFSGVAEMIWLGNIARAPSLRIP